MTIHGWSSKRHYILLLVGLGVLACDRAHDGEAGTLAYLHISERPNDADQVLEWHQAFVESLIATSTPNSSSPRLAATVHTAIFDAYNGIERAYAPILVRVEAPNDASPTAAAIAAAHRALVALFPSQQPALDEKYTASIAALTNDCQDGSQTCQRGVAWGEEVADIVLAARAQDGFADEYPPFVGGTEVGQWRPTAPDFASMSAQGLAFSSPFVVESTLQFRPDPPRSLTSMTYADDVRAVASLGRKTDSTRTDEQTAIALFWDGNASVHWNQAANQMARAANESESATIRLLAVLNIAMADASFTAWSSKRFYGADPGAVTWRPATAIPLAGTDGNSQTEPDPDWLPLIKTPAHPEYPAGHPSLNGAAAAILSSHFDQLPQEFTVTATGQPSRTYSSIEQARADANAARIWAGAHYPSTVWISNELGEAVADYVDAAVTQLPRNRDCPRSSMDSAFRF